MSVFISIIYTVLFNDNKYIHVQCRILTINHLSNQTISLLYKKMVQYFLLLYLFCRETCKIRLCSHLMAKCACKYQKRQHDSLTPITEMQEEQKKYSIYCTFYTHTLSLRFLFFHWQNRFLFVC